MAWKNKILVDPCTEVTSRLVYLKVNDCLRMMAAHKLDFGLRFTQQVRHFKKIITFHNVLVAEYEKSESTGTVQFPVLLFGGMTTDKR